MEFFIGFVLFIVVLTIVSKILHALTSIKVFEPDTDEKRFQRKKKVKEMDNPYFG